MYIIGKIHEKFIRRKWNNEMSTKDELIAYYSNTSKHSNYQILPKRLKSILGDNDVVTRTRSEEERLRYVLEKVDFKDKSVLDIGGNTGFFTFELCDAGALKVNHYEGNKEHSEFVGLAAQALDMSDRVKTTNAYFPFDGSFKDKYDVILLFNVLHHIGDDYGDKDTSVERAKSEIITELNGLKDNADTVVFQMGFNWQGDPKKPLFDKGTKEEVIDFVKTGVVGSYVIQAIGIAQRSEDGSIEYADLNDENIKRDDSLGEFLNRPIFILRSNG